MKSTQKASHLSNAELARERHAEIQAIVTGRWIKTVYYEFPDKRRSTMRTRSVHMRTALPNVIKNMQENRHDSLWAEVWNDLNGELIATVGRGVDGTIDINQYFDVRTGKKIRNQGRKIGVVSPKLTVSETEQINQLVHTLHLFEKSPVITVLAKDGVFSPDELDTSVLNPVYANTVEDLLQQIDQVLLLPETSFFNKKAVDYFEDASYYRVVQNGRGYDIVLSFNLTIHRKL